MKRTVLIGIASIIALAIGVGVVVASSSSEAPVASSTQGPDDATQANAARPLVALITQQEEAEALPEVTVPAIGGNLDRASARHL